MSLSVLGAAHFFSGRFEDAVIQLVLAIQEDPNYPPPYRSLASCYAHMGRLDDAREVFKRLQTITPLTTGRRRIPQPSGASLSRCRVRRSRPDASARITCSSCSPSRSKLSPSLRSAARSGVSCSLIRVSSAYRSLPADPRSASGKCRDRGVRPPAPSWRTPDADQGPP
jgi:pentatricopeptide repeat protein